MNSKVSTNPKAVTPIFFVKSILMAYEKYGMDPAHALEKAQIRPEWLENPKVRISALQMEQVAGAAMLELDDEALGWFSRKLPWGSYGLIARGSLTAPNLGVAFRRWLRHHNLLTDDISLHFSQSNGLAHVTITEHRPLGPGGALREFGLLSVLRNLHGYSCWLIDSHIALREAFFPFPAPDHAATYPFLLPGEVTFEADHAGFSFDAHYLTLPIRRDEQAMKQMLRHALPLVVRQYKRDRLLIHRVREVLRLETAKQVNAEDVAKTLNLSVRTLHRQLKEEGASLQGLKDDVRRREAEHLLLRSAKPIKQIAAAVGFRDEKNFARAFKQWSGQSPSEYRRQTQHSAL